MKERKRSIQAYLFNGGLDLLLVQSIGGYWTVPEGKPNENEKYVSDLSNITIWRALQVQLGLSSKQIEFLHQRPLIQLGEDIGRNQLDNYDTHNLAIYLGGSYRLTPITLLPESDISRFEWFNLHHLPSDSLTSIHYPIEQLMKGLVKNRQIYLRRKRG